MLAALLPLLGPIFDKLVGLIPDPAAAARAKAEAMQLMIDAATKADAAQMEVNKAEAASGSLFVAGWRPAVGWVCAIALAFQYLVRPLAQTSLSAAGYQAIIIPGLDDNLWQLLLGLLGMGGLRTFEKMRGVAK